MSRSLTSGMVTQVTATALRPIMLFKAAFDSGNLLLWSGVGSIVYNGDTYTGAGDLLGVKSIAEANTIEAVGVDVQLSGLPSALIATALTEDYQGRTAYIYFACLTDAGAIVADPYQIFKGRMDVLEISENSATAVLTMHCENRLIDLQRSKERRYTPEDQKAFYPTDTGLDFVAALQDKQITWGQNSAS